MTSTVGFIFNKDKDCNIIDPLTAFNSKTAIMKFKREFKEMILPILLKTDPIYWDESICKKYMNDDFKLVLTDFTDEYVYFNIEETDEFVEKKRKKELYERLHFKTKRGSIKYEQNQNEPSDRIKRVIDEMNRVFKSHHKRCSIIDLTSILSPSTYLEYQRANYYKDVVMVAEKTKENKSVFTDRSADLKFDIMIMYHGKYRLIEFDLLENYINSACAMVLNS